MRDKAKHTSRKACSIICLSDSEPRRRRLASGVGSSADARNSAIASLVWACSGAGNDSELDAALGVGIQERSVLCSPLWTRRHRSHSFDKFSVSLADFDFLKNPLLFGLPPHSNGGFDITCSGPASLTFDHLFPAHGFGQLACAGQLIALLSASFRCCLDGSGCQPTGGSAITVIGFVLTFSGLYLSVIRLHPRSFDLRPTVEVKVACQWRRQIVPNGGEKMYQSG